MTKKIQLVFPENLLKSLNKIQYKDKTNKCFQFSAKLVGCGKGAKRIPVQ